MVGVSVLALGAAVLFTLVENMQDPDGDGIPSGVDPEPFVFNGNLDTDEDGWTNGYERMMGSELTDPDEDSDGLPDGQDPDGDGMSSWFERNVAGLDPLRPNQRYYVQLMSVPFSSVNETANREFWVEEEKIRPEQYIVEYSVTLKRFAQIVDTLSRQMTDEDLLYLYLRTHGEKNGNESILCFANESAPDQADQCGKIITYRELNGYLDRIPCRAMVIVFTSCAGEEPVEVLSTGRCPRVVAGVMGLNAGIPSIDVEDAAGNATGYFSAADLVHTIAAQSTGESDVEERILDANNVSTSFYYGEYPKVLYREDHGIGVGPRGGEDEDDIPKTEYG